MDIAYLQYDDVDIITYHHYWDCNHE